MIQSVGLHDYSPIVYNNMPFKANANNTVKYNIYQPEKKKNTGWKILGAVSAAALIAAGACLHKGTKSLGKNAKIGERLEQGLNEILGKSFTKELADGTRIVKQTKNGKISSCAKYKGDTLLFKNEYTYGDSGKISHIKRIKGGELSEINFKYNGDNKLSEIIKEITKEGSEKKDIINIDFRNYDGYGSGYIQRKENGKVTGVTKFNWGKFKYRHEYEFGQNGKIRHIKNTESRKSSDINFKYDENQKLSNITKKIMTENGKLIVSSKYNGSEFLYKQKFEYGKNGKISRIEKTDKDGIKIVREPFYSNDNKVIGFRIEKELTAFHVGTRKPKYVVNKNGLYQYDADGKLVFEYDGDDPRFWSNVGDVNRISEVGGGKGAIFKTGNGTYITHKLNIDKQFNEMVNEFYIENVCKYIFTKKNQPDIKYIEYSCKIGDSRYYCEVTNGKIMQIGKSLEKDIANYHIDTGNVEIIDNSYTIDKIKEIVDKTKVIDDNIAKADKVMGDVNEAWSSLKSMSGLKEVECVGNFIN